VTDGTSRDALPTTNWCLIQTSIKAPKSRVTDALTTEAAKLDGSSSPKSSGNPEGDVLQSVTSVPGVHKSGSSHAPSLAYWHESSADCTS